ncbi:DUF2574 family protein [Citrobacter sp. U14242]|uniref:DUF2574 family protein n=1 Tax=Citrobacter sp. U14242 TaxID=3390192 RepID=UPI00397C6AF5
MKNRFLMGIIVLSYGVGFPVFASDTATLTISGSVTVPTCSADVVDSQLQQRCGNTTRLSNLTDVVSTSVRGVVTEVVAVQGDATRQIVLNHYD